MRLDHFLVLQKGFRSRTQAKDFILKGAVEVFENGLWKKILKPSFSCSEDLKVRVLDVKDVDWVSRSGKKLDEAIKRLNLNFDQKTCLDLGQSTGGFTQALLRHSAAQVVGVDIGHEQLSEDLKSDPRVVSFEGVDAREVEFLNKDWRFDFLAADLSFISILKVLPSVLRLNLEDAQALLLIKPQFEVGKDLVGKGGLIEGAELHLNCQKSIFNALKEWSVRVLDYFPSAVKGKNGNQEFFCYIEFK